MLVSRGGKLPEGAAKLGLHGELVQVAPERPAAGQEQ